MMPIRHHMPTIAAGLLAATLVSSSLFAQQAPRAAEGLSAATRKELTAAAAKGAAFIRSQQKPDGSFEFHPGITGLAATALFRLPGASREAELKTTGRALDKLVTYAKPDGGIHDDDLETYVTAIAVMALQAGGRAQDLPIAQKGREYLVKHLMDESEGLSPSDPFYGAVGYRPATSKDTARGDIINLEYGLRALKETDLRPDDPSWEKALKFLERLQNRAASNDQPWTANDGGFIYQPGLSKVEDGPTTSYGSATFAGVLSFTYANLRKDDDRVRAAVDWLRTHYTVDENPGMGQKTVYYYYMVMAKALAALGEPTLTDAKGVVHNWREELSRKLLSLQHPEGFWVNPVRDEWQDNKVLVTSFVLSGIEAILR
jgi:squalene-hopene/tetraprenyl-beta-curcumene cyclase